MRASFEGLGRKFLFLVLYLLVSHPKKDVACSFSGENLVFLLLLLPPSRAARETLREEIFWCFGATKSILRKNGYKLSIAKVIIMGESWAISLN